MKSSKVQSAKEYSEGVVVFFLLFYVLYSAIYTLVWAASLLAWVDYSGFFNPTLDVLLLSTKVVLILIVGLIVGRFSFVFLSAFLESIPVWWNLAWEYIDDFVADDPRGGEPRDDQ